MKKIILANSEDCDALACFLRTAGLTVLPCDEPLEAIKGYLSFFEREGEEIDIIFCWQFDKPIKKIIDASWHPDAMKRLTRCLTEKGWIQADEPRGLLIGFINYKKSACMRFSLESIKVMPKNIHKLINDWRTKNCLTTPRKVKI